MKGRWRRHSWTTSVGYVLTIGSGQCSTVTLGMKGEWEHAARRQRLSIKYSTVRAPYLHALSLAQGLIKELYHE